MNQVELAASKDALGQIARMPEKVRKKMLEFIDKFRQDPKQPSIHYERIHTFRDPRARTVRIGDDYRAIVVSPERGNTHLLVWVDKHDEAMQWARNKVFDVHPKLGTIQIVDVEQAERSVPVGGLAAPATDYGSAFAHLNDDDLIEAGVPPPLLPSVRQVRGTASFEALAPHLPEECRDRLEWVVLGGTLAEAEEFSARPTPTHAAPGDFAEALKSEATQQRFVQLLSTTELARVLQRGFQEWTVFLHPEQRRAVEKTYRGPARLLGGAGTGKTVAALHRVKHLADSVFTGPDDRILFTTFSTALAEDLRGKVELLYAPAGTLPAQIEVTNLHAWAVRYLRREGVDVKLAIGNARKAAFAHVVDTEGQGGFSRPFIEEEWELVVQAQGLRSRDQYLRASRRGRGGPRLKKEHKEHLWRIFVAYRALLDERGLIEIADAVRMAREHLEARGPARPYRAVIVDETQDFGPEELRLVRALALPGDNDLFLVGDAHQRIYVRPVPLSQCGIEVRGRSRKLRLNYRTTHEIRRYAVSKLQGIGVDDLDEASDDLKGYTSLLSGPPPVEVWCGSREDELDVVIRRLQEVGPGSDGTATCVITPTNRLLHEDYIPAMQAAGFEPVLVEPDARLPDRPGVRVCTMHRAKGLEFQHVLIVGLGDERFPWRVPNGLDDDKAYVRHHEARQRSLLFVAATRARDTLHVSGFGQRGLVP